MKKLSLCAKSLFLLGFSLVISACSVVSKESKDEPDILKKSSLEVIYGFDVKADSLRFLVKSNGCTNENNFSLKLDTLDSNTTEVSLHREKRDLCRGLTKLIAINMPLKNKNKAQIRFIISNPFALKPKRTKR